MPTISRRDIPGPRPGQRDDTSNSQAVVFVICVAAMAFLFLIWRRVSVFKSVVQHRLKTFTSNEGAIRLPHEDGPPAEIFNEDEELDETDHIMQHHDQQQSANPSVSTVALPRAQTKDAAEPVAA